MSVPHNISPRQSESGDTEPRPSPRDSREGSKEPLRRATVGTSTAQSAQLPPLSRLADLQPSPGPSRRAVLPLSSIAGLERAPEDVSAPRAATPTVYVQGDIPNQTGLPPVTSTRRIELDHTLPGVAPQVDQRLLGTPHTAPARVISSFHRNVDSPERASLLRRRAQSLSLVPPPASPRPRRAASHHESSPVPARSRAPRPRVLVPPLSHSTTSSDSPSTGQSGPNNPFHPRTPTYDAPPNRYLSSSESHMVQSLNASPTPSLEPEQLRAPRTALPETRMVTFSAGHEPIPVSIDIQGASRDAGEKRKRNAGASARFRARKREREQASDMEVEDLRQQLHAARQDATFYRSERDLFSQAVFHSPQASQYFPRPTSPRHRRTHPAPETPPQNPWSTPPFPRFEESGERGGHGRQTRRRLGEPRAYHEEMTASGLPSYLPGAPSFYTQRPPPQPPAQPLAPVAGAVAFSGSTPFAFPAQGAGGQSRAPPPPLLPSTAPLERPP